MKRVQVFLESIGMTLLSIIGVVILVWCIYMGVSIIFNDEHKFIIMILQVITYITVVTFFVKHNKKIKKTYNEIKTSVVDTK
jgi:ABC-type multidrug transport system permease subunit